MKNGQRKIVGKFKEIYSMIFLSVFDMDFFS